MTRTRVYLCWYSLKYIDFDHLSALAGIQPTRIEEKGTPVLHDGSPLYEIESLEKDQHFCVKKTR